MTLRALRRIAEIAPEVNGTEVDFDLLEERYRLAERECTLEQKMDLVESAVLTKHPDAQMARLIVGDILRIDKRTALRRRSALMRMKERAVKVIEIVDRELVAEQFEMKMEMYEIKKFLFVNEAKIKEQVWKRRSADVEETSAKQART